MSNEIAKVGDLLPAHILEHTDMMADMLQEAKEGTDPQFKLIKVAAGGINLFQRSDEETFKELHGIIIAYAKSFAFWYPKEATEQAKFFELLGNTFTVESEELPICTSNNGIVGTQPKYFNDGNGLMFFGDCNSCWLNQFGSSFKGHGKACQNRRRILFLFKDAEFPCIVSLPPTSIRAFDGYIAHLLELKVGAPFVYTRIRLEKKETKDGQPYSVAKFDLPAKPDFIDEKDMAIMIQLRKAFEKTIKSAPASREEFDSDPTKPIDVEVEIVSPIEDKVKDDDLPF
jgi:hypothetical protein